MGHIKEIVRSETENKEIKSNRLNLITADISDVFFDEPPGREKEYKILLDDVLRVFKYNVDTHRFIFGQTGSGKTYVAKTFVYNFNKDMKEEGMDDKYHAIYIGGTYAMNQRTNIDASSHFYEWLNNMVVEGLVPDYVVRDYGYKVDDTGKVIKPRKNSKSAILVFDDIMSILRGHTSLEWLFLFFDDIQIIKEWDSLLRPLLRYMENRRSQEDVSFNTYYITTSRSIIEKKVPPDLRAHFGWKMTTPGGAIIFMRYNAEKMRKIFRARLSVALPDHTVTDEILMQIARYTENMWAGNIRIGLRALKDAIEYAFQNLKVPEELTDEEVRYVLHRTQLLTQIAEIRSLENHQKIILMALSSIKTSSGVDFYTLYRKYKDYIRDMQSRLSYEIRPLSITPFYTRLNELLDTGILLSVSDNINKSSRGRPRMRYGFNIAGGWHFAFSEYMKRHLEEDFGLVPKVEAINNIREGKMGAIEDLGGIVR